MLKQGLKRIVASARQNMQLKDIEAVFSQAKLQIVSPSKST